MGQHLSKIFALPLPCPAWVQINFLCIVKSPSLPELYKVVIITISFFSTHNPIRKIARVGGSFCYCFTEVKLCPI